MMKTPRWSFLRLFTLTTALLGCALVSSAAHAQLLPIEQQPARDILSFLRDAEVVASERLPYEIGINRPYKLTLKLGEREGACLFKDVEGQVKGHKEHWRYEIAAYLMDRALGMGMVPPTVERTFEGRKGSCQLWIESAETVWIVSERNRKEGVMIPGEKAQNWQRRLWLREAFDNLIGNDDRNMGNCLVTPDWRLILIDHSRGFRTARKYRKNLLYEGPEMQRRLPQNFVQRIDGIDAATLARVVGEYLTPEEQEAILARRDLLIGSVQNKIARYGIGDVLYR